MYKVQVYTNCKSANLHINHKPELSLLDPNSKTALLTCLEKVLLLIIVFKYIWDLKLLTPSLYLDTKIVRNCPRKLSYTYFINILFAVFSSSWGWSATLAILNSWYFAVFNWYHSNRNDSQLHPSWTNCSRFYSISYQNLIPN